MCLSNCSISDQRIGPPELKFGMEDPIQPLNQGLQSMFGSDTPLLGLGALKSGFRKYTC